MQIIRFEKVDQLEFREHGQKDGLYVHGFRPGSRAERQGKIQVGDEILEINSVNVEGQELTALVNAMKKVSLKYDNEDSDSVWIKIRRKN